MKEALTDLWGLMPGRAPQRADVSKTVCRRMPIIKTLSDEFLTHSLADFHFNQRACPAGVSSGWRS